MKSGRIFCTLLLLAFWSLEVNAQMRVYEASRMGLKPNSSHDAGMMMKRILKTIQQEYVEGDSVVLRFAPGRYDFYEKGASIREYFISNHDQRNPKMVGIPLEGMKHFTLDGGGAEFVFHGRMLPVSLVNSSNCTLQNFSIDFEVPHITQIQVVENMGDRGIVFRPAPYVKYRVTREGEFEVQGEGWSNRPRFGIPFEEAAGHVVYNTGDTPCALHKVEEIEKGVLAAPEWKDSRLVKSTVIALRTWRRPAPGIFMAENVNTVLSQVKVHYAEGMGLLAQLCENITMDGFSVCLKEYEGYRRYFKIGRASCRERV